VSSVLNDAYGARFRSQILNAGPPADDFQSRK
jgi:hypothetical protein